MKTKLTALALTAALLIGGPAFAHDGGSGARGGGGGVRGGAFESGRSTPTVAFGGSTYNSRAYSNSRGGNYTYAFSSHPGWSPGRAYAWNGHNYRWYNNGWVIIDPDPYYGYYNDYYAPGYTVYGTADDQGGSIDTQVQAALAQQGYYQGPIDGIVGPVTTAAIAAYQKDNGLGVTGAINTGLLRALKLD